MKEILIVVPYRNRELHLKEFYKRVPKYFNERNILYDIVIVELEEGGDWNAGLCNNSIIYYLNNINDKYKYIYIHHVDIYPVSGDFIFPKENECIINMGDYGSTILHLEKFLQVGGYLNSYWGWGSEDNHFYAKLAANGIKLIDFDKINEKNLVFDVEFQNHPRPFVAKNYANNSRRLHDNTLNKDDDIFTFDKFGKVLSIDSIEDDIYLLKVQPLKKSPNQFKNKKAVFLYAKNKKEFSYVSTVVKSALLYSSYEYDLIMFLSGVTPEDNIYKESIAHGCNVIQIKQGENFSIIPMIERFYEYRKFLENNKNYEHILHIDAADSVFFDNPFKYVDPYKLTLSQEDILNRHQIWNSNFLKNLFKNDINEIIYDNPVICSGVFSAPHDIFFKFISAIIDEYEKLSGDLTMLYGLDQPIVNKLIYVDKIFTDSEIEFKTTYDNFCINLHVPLGNDPNYFGKSISVPIDISELKSYSIVHQYNRNTELYNRIFTHYKTYLSVL